MAVTGDYPTNACVSVRLGSGTSSSCYDWSHCNVGDAIIQQRDDRSVRLDRISIALLYIGVRFSATMLTYTSNTFTGAVVFLHSKVCTTFAQVADV